MQYRRRLRRFDMLIRRHSLFVSRIRFHLSSSIRLCTASSCCTSRIMHFFFSMEFVWQLFLLILVECVYVQKLNRCIAGDFIYLLLVYLVCVDSNMWFLWSRRSHCGVWCVYLLCASLHPNTFYIFCHCNWIDARTMNSPKIYVFVFFYLQSSSRVRASNNGWLRWRWSIISMKMQWRCKQNFVVAKYFMFCFFYILRMHQRWLSIYGHLHTTVHMHSYSSFEPTERIRKS